MGYVTRAASDLAEVLAPLTTHDVESVPPRCTEDWFTVTLDM
jgi:hypothetical protein